MKIAATIHQDNIPPFYCSMMNIKQMINYFAILKKATRKGREKQPKSGVVGNEKHKRLQILLFQRKLLLNYFRLFKIKIDSGKKKLKKILEHKKNVAHVFEE